MKPLNLISLNLRVMTYQSLQWVILSLRNDEMTPSEKGLQSRIKEAFGLKLDAQVWEMLMSSIKHGY
jgi:hypothetical protein